MLSPEQIAKRGEIGASDIPTIVNGNEDQVLTKWRQLVGLEPPADLTESWPVQYGVHMEPFILSWHERKLGYQLTDRGEVLYHPELAFVTCTLDAYDASRKATIEVKTTAWSKDWATQFYWPQLMIQRACRGAELAIMLLCTGGREPEEIELEFDQVAYNEVLARVRAFKLCMETMTPPVALAQLVPPEKWRTINLETETQANYRDELIEHLMDWRANREAAQLHEQAAASAKSLVPQDCGRLLYQDIRISRDKRGHLSIRSSDHE